MKTKLYFLPHKALLSWNLNAPMKYLKQKGKDTLRKICNDSNENIGHAENIKRNYFTNNRMRWEYSLFHEDKRITTRVFHIGFPLYIGKIDTIENKVNYRPEKNQKNK